MKNKKIIIMLIITILALIGFIPKSNAAIQIKEGTSAQRNLTVNNAFQYCQDMKYQSSTLGNNTLDPHLSTARDWGAVAYLGLSSYGSVRSATGDTISINSKNYYTTTGNISGVLNFGKDASVSSNQYTFVASKINGRSHSGGATSILDNANNKKYVDFISSPGKNIGMADGETYNWYSAACTSTNWDDHVVLVRNGVFGYTNDPIDETYGKPCNTVTYRPAIWN